MSLILGCRRDAALLLLHFRGAAACVRSFPLVRPYKKLCWVRPWSLRPHFLPHIVGCGSSGTLQEQGKWSALVSVGMVGFNTRMCGTFGFPARAVLNIPGWILEAAVNRKRGKIGDAEAWDCWGEWESWSLYTLVSLLSFLWDAEAFGPIIVVGQWMLGWRKQVLKEGGKWFIFLGGRGRQDGRIWPIYKASSSGTWACA